MITIQENIPLAPLTTFNIGGASKYFVSVSSQQDILEALQYVKEHRLSLFVLGGGSNILFSDDGFDGLIIKLENHDITVNGTIITTGAGAKLSEVVSYAGKHALSGVELLAGIPGSVGGAVRGNAGAFGVEIGSLVTRVICLNIKTLETNILDKETCAFAYRQSFFKTNPQWLILSVDITLMRAEGSDDLIRIARETIAKREAKHPQNLLCAGSFFMNPFVLDPKLQDEFFQDTGVRSRDGKLPAGWLIDHVDLRGKRIGGAQVSEIHPNYLINTGNATAEDILILSSIIKQRVRTQLGIELKEEAQLVGF
jgi:UDP-N-acetylmuramate dehydrogenase